MDTLTTRTMKHRISDLRVSRAFLEVPGSMHASDTMRVVQRMISREFLSLLHPSLGEDGVTVEIPCDTSGVLDRVFKKLYLEQVHCSVSISNRSTIIVELTLPLHTIKIGGDILMLDKILSKEEYYTAELVEKTTEGNSLDSHDLDIGVNDSEPGLGIEESVQSAGREVKQEIKVPTAPFLEPMVEKKVPVNSMRALNQKFQTMKKGHGLSCLVMPLAEEDERHLIRAFIQGGYEEVTLAHVLLEEWGIKFKKKYHDLNDRAGKIVLIDLRPPSV